MDKTPASTTPPPIQQQNNQGQGSLRDGSDTYRTRPTAGWNNRTQGSTAKDSTPFG